MPGTHSKTTKELTAEAFANLPPVSSGIGIEKYYRSLRNIKLQGDGAYGKNDEMAYINYKRYLKIRLEIIPKHKDYNKASTSSLRSNADYEEAMKRVEELHKRLLAAQERALVIPPSSANKVAPSVSDDELEKRFRKLMGNDESSVQVQEPPPPSAPIRDEPSAPPLPPPDNDYNSRSPSYPTLVRPAISGAPSPTVQTVQYITVPPPPPPVFDREHQAIPKSFPLSTSGFRRIIIFEGVLRQFMAMADKNNRLDIETCGLLCCRIEGDNLVLDTCLVPKQKGTRDTCSTLNEEEQFEFLDAKNLILAGWIHTHPTQPCFLSSVDLHTHFGYQTMLTEAIAIVVAPRSTPNYGIFTMHPEGLNVLRGCDLGGFHVHPSKPLYVPTPVHVLVVQGDVNIVDQRSR